MKRQLSILMLGGLLFVTCGCGQGNIFSFAHSPGSNSSTTALSSDASQALQNKDWPKAMKYYQQILNTSPGNTQAIYGYCSAELASSGMDIASLVSNLVGQQNNGSNNSGNNSAYNRLSSALAYAAHAFASSNLLPQTIISNKLAIENAVDDVLGSGHLLKIIQGKGDGTIAPDNVDVNVNIAFCLVLKAAFRVYDSKFITFDDNYNVTVTAGTKVTDQPVIDVANASGKDIASAYQRLLAVYNKLNLGKNSNSNSMIGNINGDVKDLFDRLNTAVPGTDVDSGTDYYYFSGIF